MATLSPSALALLQVLSILDGAGIQPIILVADSDNVALPDYPKSEEACRDAITELIGSCLVTSDRDATKLRIHPLVQVVIRERLSKEETSAVFEATIRLLSNRWPFVNFHERNQVGRLQKCEELFPHMERLSTLFGRSIESGEFLTSTASAALFNEVAW